MRKLLLPLLFVPLMSLGQDISTTFFLDSLDLSFTNEDSVVFIEETYLTYPSVLVVKSTMNPIDGIIVTPGRWARTSKGVTIEGSIYERYKDGKRNGITRIFNESATLFCEVSYRDGKKEGLTKIYYEPLMDDMLNWSSSLSQQLMMAINFENDKLVWTKCWDRKGNTIECP